MDKIIFFGVYLIGFVITYLCARRVIKIWVIDKGIKQTWGNIAWKLLFSFFSWFGLIVFILNISDLQLNIKLPKFRLPKIKLPDPPNWL